MNSLLLITLTDESYTIDYREDGESLLVTKKKYGLLKLEDFKLRERAAYLLLDPLLHTLEKISLYERIPMTVHVITKRHGPWIKHILKEYPYTQFYTGQREMNVILEKVNSNLYAGHTKETFKFKI
jgi:hypothetical protein